MTIFKRFADIDFTPCFVCIASLLLALIPAPASASLDDALLLKLRKSSDQTEQLKQRAVNALLAIERARFAPGAGVEPMLRVYVNNPVAGLSLEWVELHWGGTVLFRHEYREIEVHALQAGGVQLLYRGALPPAEGPAELRYSAQRARVAGAPARPHSGVVRTPLSPGQDLELRFLVNRRHDVLLEPRWRPRD